MSLSEYLKSRRALIDRTIDLHLPPETTPPASIHQAMRHAVLGGGKRIRPILGLAAAGLAAPAISSRCSSPSPRWS